MSERMVRFPPEVKFRAQWRPYQARVLSDMEKHLGDNRLHIVAAPGSGKTLLGLEVVRRLDTSTLIIAPTLAIRDQWITRFLDFYTDTPSNVPDWISTDLRNPGFLTVTTYQGLYSAYGGRSDEYSADEDSDNDNAEGSSEEGGDIPEDGQSVECMTNPDEVVNLFRTAGLQTIVLDEAHHLRVNWWRCLNSLLKSFPDATTVSLTATPPYDVSAYEWERYMALCGPIDSEVSIPELVREGNLCPHQDLLMLTPPSSEESQKSRKFKESVQLLIDNLQSRDEFARLVQSHPWVISPNDHIEELLDDTAFFSSMLIFLRHKEMEIPESCREIVTGSYHAIPLLNREWLEILLEGLFFPLGVMPDDLPPVLVELRDRLARMGALDNRNVNLITTKHLDAILRKSVNKLQTIDYIVESEFKSLGNRLRMVILTDFIRKAYLPTSLDEAHPLDKIGAVPIFESIRRIGIPDCKVGVLTGTLVILPEDSWKSLLECAEEMNIDSSMIVKISLADPRYCRIVASEATKHCLVPLVTRLFSKGGVNVLVGTKSLLGEGWDAPSVNSLVIASFVGSYMLSNQMRGRAIRSERGNPDKTANIWHIACVDTGSKNPGDDYQTMVRRFKAFLGLSAREPVIENGISRLGLPEPPFDEQAIKNSNQSMIVMAGSRGALRASWETALQRENEGVGLIEDIVAKRVHLPRGFVFRDSLAVLADEILVLVCFFLVRQIVGIFIPMTNLGFALLAYIPQIGLLLFAVRLLPKAFKAVKLFVRHGPIKSSLRQIGQALLVTLCGAGTIRTDIDRLAVVVEEGERNAVFCHIKGATSREANVYLHALRELLGPIDSPRYLLVRKSRFGRSFTRHDYHSVPSVLGIKREYSDLFAQEWSNYVGDMDLIYTRSPEGRLILLRARNHSLSAGFRPRTERVSRWR